jgi:hypothetical protein
VRFITRLLINAAALWAAIRLVPGISFEWEWPLLFAVASAATRRPPARAADGVGGPLGRLARSDAGLFDRRSNGRECACRT